METESKLKSPSQMMHKIIRVFKSISKRLCGRRHLEKSDTCRSVGDTVGSCRRLTKDFNDDSVYDVDYTPNTQERFIETDAVVPLSPLIINADFKCCLQFIDDVVGNVVTPPKYVGEYVETQLTTKPLKYTNGKLTCCRKLIQEFPIDNVSDRIRDFSINESMETSPGDISTSSPRKKSDDDQDYRRQLFDSTDTSNGNENRYLINDDTSDIESVGVGSQTHIVVDGRGSYLMTYC